MKVTGFPELGKGCHVPLNQFHRYKSWVFNGLSINNMACEVWNRDYGDLVQQHCPVNLSSKRGTFKNDDFFLWVWLLDSHIGDIIQYLSFSDISLSIMTSRSIHVVANCRISFFSVAEKYSIVYICHIYFFHSSVDGHKVISKSCILWIMTQLTWSTVSFQYPVFIFFGHITRNEIAKSFS